MFCYSRSPQPSRERGVYEFIRKPVKSHELLTRIRNALDYKLLLDERKHAEIALTESELKFRQIFDNLQVGVYILQNEKVVFSNSILNEIFQGYSGSIVSEIDKYVVRGLTFGALKG